MFPDILTDNMYRSVLFKDTEISIKCLQSEKSRKLTWSCIVTALCANAHAFGQ